MPINFEKMTSILEERKRDEKIKGRESRRFSQKELLRLIDKPSTVWNRIKERPQKSISYADAKIIASYLGVSVDEIWETQPLLSSKPSPASNARIIEYLESIEKLAKEIRALLIQRTSNV